MPDFSSFSSPFREVRDSADFAVESLPRQMAPLATSVEPWPEDGQKRSAVCMLFIPAPAPALDDKGAAHPEAHLVLTKRTTSVRTHRGQIGFAGGHVDPGDGDPARTALRELEEELGVPSKTVLVHGTLPTHAAVTGIPVTTVVATAAMHPRDFVLSPGEVAEVITAPWSRFRPEESHPFRFNLFGVWRRSELFMVEGHRVWGLTAHIIRDAAFA